jgi:hypothetical protein
MANSLGMLDMATRGTAEVTGRPDKSTEFQLYVGRGGQSNVIDFTLHKLILYATKAQDMQQKMTLFAMIEDYRNGNIAIAWRRGRPVHLKVTKDV